MLWRPGSSWGFGALLKSTSSCYSRWRESAVHLLPHRQFLPDQDSNSQPFDYESDSLSLGHDSHKEILCQTNNIIGVFVLPLCLKIYTTHYISKFYKYIFIHLTLVVVFVFNLYPSLFVYMCLIDYKQLFLFI